MILKKISVWPFAKFYAVFMAVLGFIIGLLFALINLAAPIESPYQVFGFATIVVFPIIYGLMGFAMGLVTSWLYNLVAKFVGGIELDFDNKK